MEGGQKASIVQKPLPVAAWQPGAVDVPPSEGEEVADCEHIVRKSHEYIIVLTESAKEGTSIGYLVSKIDVDPEKISSQSSMCRRYEVRGGTLRCEAQCAYPG